MAKIDFNSKNEGVKIHDDGDYVIPENVISDPKLSVPERFGLNTFENPKIVFDRFPGMSDAQVLTELDRLWKEDVWPRRLALYYQRRDQVNAEAFTRLENGKWELERALDQASGDYSDAKVVAVLADRQDVRDKSSEVITKLKADLLARKDPDDWTNFEIWDSAYVEHSGNVTVHAALGKGFVGLSDAQLMEKAKTIHDIEDPGRTS
tara:strand:- start:201 stop:821 length:621 start_codon:yes stop_codon:yes gene_type:complete